MLKQTLKNQGKSLNEKIQGKSDKIHLIKDTQKIQGNPGNIMEANQEKRGFESGCLAYHLRWGEGLVLPRSVRITAHYPQISLFAGLAYGCVVMRLYVCVYTIVC